MLVVWLLQKQNEFKYCVDTFAKDPNEWGIHRFTVIMVIPESSLDIIKLFVTCCGLSTFPQVKHVCLLCTLSKFINLLIFQTHRYIINYSILYKLYDIR